MHIYYMFVAHSSATQTLESMLSLLSSVGRCENGHFMTAYNVPIGQPFHVELRS